MNFVNTVTKTENIIRERLVKETYIDGSVTNDYFTLELTEKEILDLVDACHYEATKRDTYHTTGRSERLTNLGTALWQLIK